MPGGVPPPSGAPGGVSVRPPRVSVGSPLGAPPSPPACAGATRDASSSLDTRKPPARQYPKTLPATHSRIQSMAASRVQRRCHHKSLSLSLLVSQLSSQPCNLKTHRAETAWPSLSDEALRPAPGIQSAHEEHAMNLKA